MKSTILLTTALFLMSAPSPDSKSVSEMSAGFLAESNDLGLMAAGPASDGATERGSAAPLAVNPALEASLPEDKQRTGDPQISAKPAMSPLAQQEHKD